MRTPLLLSAAAASFLIVQPVMAQAVNAAQGSAQRLSLANAPAVRAGAAMNGTSAARGGGGWIIGLIGVIAGVTYAFIQKEDDDDDDEPASP